MINFLPSEKELILAAITLEKELQKRSNDEELEGIEEMEDEIIRENIFLSRTQLSILFDYLEVLLDRKDRFNQTDVISLGVKLNELINLP